ncbi:MAG: cysteine peptidase family C39 domain-containing protein [Pseudomonadota bacterium]
MRKRFKVNIKTILQLSETECGMAALAMLLAYHRVNLPIEILREQCGSSRDGCKATTLLTVAREFGFQADGYRVELEDIIALAKPVIAFWNFNHYVVICGAGPKNVIINDPARGKMTISLAEFDKAFTGIILAITPTEKAMAIKSPWPLKSYFKEWLWQFKKEWLFITVISLLYMCGPLLTSLISSVFINYCIIGSNRLWLPWLALFAVVLAAFMMLTTITQQVYLFKISAKASLLKTSRLIGHTLKLPLQYFSVRQKSGIVAILAHAEMVLDSLFKNLTGFVINIFMALCSLVAMLAFDAQLTLKLISIIIISGIAIGLISRINLAYEKNNINTENKLYAFAIASLRNLETIKACALEQEILAKWYNLFCNNLQGRARIAVVATKVATLNQFANTLAMLAMLYWGSVSVAQGSLSIGNLIAYYALLLIFSKNSEAILLVYKEGQKAYAAHLLINDLKNYPTDKRFETNQSPVVVDDSQPILKCVKVNFFYNKRSEPVLSNIELEVGPGQKIALVGATGSGKSTLAKLLCGLYAFDSGEILMSGNSIASFTELDFFKNFSYVSQEIALFSGTIYENLLLGQADIPLQKINHAIHQAGLLELIAQRGLHAQVAENGDNFSGGEKQRLEIARALLHDAPILILDEATSALDLATEAYIIENLRAMRKTIIYVAHRLSTIKHCDRIYVLEHGRIVEQGRHDQLLRNKQQYFQLTHEEDIQ